VRFGLVVGLPVHRERAETWPRISPPGKAHGVHVGVAIADAECVQEGGEVVGIEALVGGAGVQGDDVSGSGGSGDRAGGGLRAIGLGGIGGACPWVRRREGHDVSIHAALSKVNVGKERRAGEAGPGKGPAEGRAIRTQLGAESSSGAGTLGRNLVEGGQVGGERHQPVFVVIGHVLEWRRRMTSVPTAIRIFFLRSFMVSSSESELGICISRSLRPVQSRGAVGPGAPKTNRGARPSCCAERQLFTLLGRGSRNQAGSFSAANMRQASAGQGGNQVKNAQLLLATSRCPVELASDLSGFLHFLLRTRLVERANPAGGAGFALSGEVAWPYRDPSAA